MNDATIICEDGKFHSNSFLLSAIFPVIRKVFQTLNSEEEVIISLPDVRVGELELFFQDIHQRKETLHVGSSISSLLEVKEKLKFNVQNCPEFKDEVKLNDSEIISPDIDGGTFSPPPDPELDNLHPGAVNLVKIKIARTELERGKKRIRRGRKCKGECGDPECNFIYFNSGRFQKHIAGEYSYVPQACHLCGYLPRSIRSHVNHMLGHEEGWKGKRMCNLCRKILRKEVFEEHVKGCNPVKEPVVCNICGKTISKSSISTHMQRMHPSAPLEKKFMCHKCDKTFLDDHNLKRHMVSHEEKTACPECGLKVRKMKLHMRVSHTPDDQKKFQCPDCGKGFIQKRTLGIHRMNVHLKLQPYKCRYGCDIAYNDSSNRAHHEKKKHGKLFTTMREEKF